MKKKKYDTEIRCRTCGRLFVKGTFRFVGEMEFYCSRCKSTFTLRALRPNLAPQDGLSGDRHASTPPLHT